MTVHWSPFFTQPVPVVRVRLLLSGDDQVADPDDGPGRGADAVGFHLAGGDPVGAGALVQLGDGVVVGGDHQRPFPGGDVGLPGVVEPVEHRVAVAALDPAVVLVGVGCVGDSDAQVDGCFAVPTGG